MKTKPVPGRSCAFIRSGHESRQPLYSSPVRNRGLYLSLIVCLVVVCNGAAAQRGQKPAAIHSDTQAGQYINKWWVAGPVSIQTDQGGNIPASVQEKFFKELAAPQIKLASGKPLQPLEQGGRRIPWVFLESADRYIDFDSLFRKADHAAGYAFTEIQSEQERTVFLAIGSDDGVKVWLNGTLVHSKFMARGANPDEDLVSLPLVKGRNLLAVAVQDITGSWGFMARLLDRGGLTQKLVDATAAGNLDDIGLLVQAGADLNGKNAKGLSPFAAASIKGRQEAAELLLQKGAARQDPPSSEALIDTQYQWLDRNSQPGIAIMVTRKGAPVYKKAFGFADIENRMRVSPDTKFRIGSITKQFVAAGILLLQEEGKLKVSDPLSKYFPGFPRGNEVTLHHLLTHTSGIHSYTNTDSFVTKVTRPVTNEELLNYFISLPYDFNPGEKYLYNNSGYFLLGYILEKVSGKSLADFLKERFFEPAGMVNTGVYSSDLRLDKEAKGYTTSDSGFVKALNWDMSWAAGAGALYSTVEDLSKWNQALFSGKVLSDKSLQAALTPVVLNNGTTPELNYGYGWLIGELRGEKSFGHSGGLHGFLSQLAYYPRSGLSVAILTNVTPAQAELNPNLIAEFVLWKELDAQASVSVKPADSSAINEYLGRYDLRSVGILTITAEGNNLFAQISGQQSFPVFPAGPDQYFWKVVEAQLSFLRDSTGKVTGASIFQNNLRFTGNKLSDSVAAGNTVSVYAEYVGDYQYKQNTVISITTADGKLYAQPKKDGVADKRLELLPVSGNEFIINEMNIRISFRRSEDGKINTMIADGQGQRTESPRVN